MALCWYDLGQVTTSGFTLHVAHTIAKSRCYCANRSCGKYFNFRWQSCILTHMNKIHGSGNMPKLSTLHGWEMTVVPLFASASVYVKSGLLSIPIIYNFGRAAFLGSQDGGNSYYLDGPVPLFSMVDSRTTRELELHYAPSRCCVMSPIPPPQCKLTLKGAPPLQGKAEFLSLMPQFWHWLPRAMGN